MSGGRHCLVTSEVAKHHQARYQNPADVKSSTALILECRPWLVSIYMCSIKALQL